MMSVGNLIIKHSKGLLEKKQHAIFWAAALSLIPFASWLSVALILLVTLRKGAQSGFEVMLPALVIHSVPLMMLVPLESALINTLITYIPCYIAALSLRRTGNWQMVFGVFLTQAVISSSLVQYLAPDFALDQFNQLKSALLSQYQEYHQLINGAIDRVNSFLIAQLFFGIQVLSVIISGVCSLLFARSTQATLFVPGAFKNELLEFRSGKISFLILTAVSMASYYKISLAINLLPLILSYFLLSGFNLVYFIFSGKNKKQNKIFILLFLLIVFKPSFVLLAYIALGSLDSLFNFRLYLPERAREST